MPAQSALHLRDFDLRSSDLKSSALKSFDLNNIARRWQELAERRLASYEELYRSGRWTHYYATQEQFAARMLEVISVAKAFHKIAGSPPPPVSHQDPSPRTPLRPAA